MTDACSSCRSGLAAATLRLDKAANAIAGFNPSAPEGQSGAGGNAITGATSSPASGLGDLPGAILDLMSAELAFRANAMTLASSQDMLQSLYKAVD